MFDDSWVNINNYKALGLWLGALCSSIMDFAFGSRIIRMPANLLAEYKNTECEVLFSEAIHFLQQKKASICDLGPGREEYYDCITTYIFQEGRTGCELAIRHKVLTSPICIRISHLALSFLLDLSLCKTLRGKLTPLPIFSIMKIKAMSFFALQHELPCYLLFIFQNCWNLLMSGAHFLLQLLSSIT